MRTVLLIVAVLAAVVCADFPRWHELEGLNYNFDMYLQDSGLPYVKGTDEYNFREGIFNAKLAQIKAHNKDKTQSYKKGVNQFTTMTAEEFKAYNRAIPNYKLTDKAKFEQYKPTRGIRDLPKYVDYRLRTNPPILTAVKNQGACGNCWAHSTVESVESYFAIKYGQLPVLSTQQVTSCTTADWGCGGGGYGAGWSYITNSTGLNEEWTYPFVDFFAVNESRRATQPCQNITKKFPVMRFGNQSFTFAWWPKANVTHHTYLLPNSAHAMMEALALVGPQSISVAASDWSDYEAGIFHNNYSTNVTNMTWQSIDHAVQMVGYGYDFDLNQNYWIVRNSWGTNFGEEGFIRLSRPEVEPCGNMTGYEVCGTSGVLCDGAFPHVAKLAKKYQNL